MLYSSGFFQIEPGQLGLCDFSLTLVSEPGERQVSCPKALSFVQLQVRFKAGIKSSQKRRG